MNDARMVMNKRGEKVKLQITAEDVAKVLQIYDDIEINNILDEISDLIEQSKLENIKKEIIKYLKELKKEIFGIDQPVKCVDRIWRKNNLVGYCHLLTHSGYLTPDLMKQHECLQKQCPFFKKLESSSYWKNKTKTQSLKRRQNSKGNRNRKNRATGIRLRKNICTGYRRV